MPTGVTRDTWRVQMVEAARWWQTLLVRYPVNAAYWRTFAKYNQEHPGRRMSSRKWNEKINDAVVAGKM